MVFAKGINCAGTELGGMEEAVRAAADADVVLLTLGGKNGCLLYTSIYFGTWVREISVP